MYIFYLKQFSLKDIKLKNLREFIINPFWTKYNVRLIFARILIIFLIFVMNNVIIGLIMVKNLLN